LLLIFQGDFTMADAALGLDLQNVLLPQRIIFIDQADKREALERLGKCLSAADEIEDKGELMKGIFHREDLMSTGVGLGIGVPHVRLASVSNPVMAVGICRELIVDYESMDNQPVSLIFMIAAGEGQHAEHLRLLSAVSSRCADASLRNALKQAQSAEEVMKLLGVG